MNLTWNIVRKDIYRLRWALVLWAVALAACGAFAAIQSVLDEEGAYAFARGAWLFNAIFCPVIAFGLVMAAQNDDPVVEADAFWITRPISGSRLLAAKAIFLALLLLLPIIVAAPLWLSRGFSLYQLLDAGTDIIKDQFAIMALAVPFAIISPDIGRFVVNVLAAAVVIATMWLVYSLCGLGRFVAASDSLLESRTLVIANLWVATSMAVALVQFRSRRTKYSLVLLVGGAFFGFLVAVFWTWNVIPARHPGDLIHHDASKAEDDKLLKECWDAAIGYAVASNSIKPKIIATLSATAGTTSINAGSVLRIVEIVTNAPPPYEITMSITESTPTFPHHFFETLLQKSAEPEVKSYYFLVNRDDSRSLVADISHTGETFDFASIHYYRTTLKFGDRSARDNNLPESYHDWIKGAVLVKITAPNNAPLERSRL